MRERSELELLARQLLSPAEARQLSAAGRRSPALPTVVEADESSPLPANDIPAHAFRDWLAQHALAHLAPVLADLGAVSRQDLQVAAATDAGALAAPVSDGGGVYRCRMWGCPSCAWSWR